MYQGVQTQRSCVRAWAAASSSIIAGGDEGYNVLIDVTEPTVHDEDDNIAIKLVDDFLRENDQYPIASVANTIFPQALYDAHGTPEFFQVAHCDYDKLTVTKRWGRYFERITRHATLEGESYNPLMEMIAKIRRQETANRRYKAAYELAVYDPLLDGRTLYGGQCLSFLSFKLHPECGLMLTAMYRNHTYITRCLGNLIGLGRLQSFVASESGVALGSLTVISTHAELDAGSWGKVEARNLTKKASEILNM